MNSKITWLLSVVASIALGLGIGYKLGKPASQTPEDRTTEASAATQKAAAIPVAHAVPAPDLTTTNGATFDWTKVESSDYKQYIANLRAIGCPEETIRDIIVADVNKLFASRAKMGSTNRFEYWKGGNPLGNLFNEETIARQQEMAKEKKDLLVTLLGADVQKDVSPSMASAGGQIYEAMLDFVPASKQSELIQLEEKFAGKMMGTIKKASQGDMSGMRALQAEKDEELLKILTPEEKFQYDMRMSQTAMVLRMQMGDLELSENEFQEVFRLRKQIDDEFGIEGMAQSNKADQEKRDAARKAMNEQLKESLGDRYSEYKYELGGKGDAPDCKPEQGATRKSNASLPDDRCRKSTGGPNKSEHRALAGTAAEDVSGDLR
jgi:hypothetical protein